MRVVFDAWTISGKFSNGLERTVRDVGRRNALRCAYCALRLALRRSSRLRRVHGLDAIQYLAEIALRDLNIVVGLQIEPKLRRGTERLAEPQRGVGGYPGLFVGDPLDSRPRQAADPGKSARRHLERDEELLAQNLAGMHGLELPGHVVSSSWRMIFSGKPLSASRDHALVVVDDLDLGWALRCPDKTHAELIVDPDRVLPLAVACQRLKAVARRRRQVAEIGRRVEIAQFPARHLDQIRWKALRTLAVENGFSDLVAEAPDHRS